jgi:DNA-binding NarL/FixJ family response regulator
MVEREHFGGMLTKRQLEITTLVSAGLSNKDVGRRLNLAEGTVKIHLHNIYDRLGVANRTALAVMARREGTGRATTEFLKRPTEPRCVTLQTTSPSAKPL